MSFASWWFIAALHLQSKNPFTGRSRQPCTILWMAATTATNSAWHFIHGWGSSYPGCITSTENSHCLAGGNSHQVSQCHFQQRLIINVCCGVLGNNLIGLYVTGDVWHSVLQKFYGQWNTSVFRRVLCSTRKNVATTWRGTSTWQQRSKGIFKRKVWIKTVWKKLPGGLACSVTLLLSFFGIAQSRECLTVLTIRKASFNNGDLKWKPSLVSETKWDACHGNIPWHNNLQHAEWW